MTKKGLGVALPFVFLSACGSDIVDESLRQIELQACISEASQAVSRDEAEELCSCTIDKLTETHGSIDNLSDAEIDVAVAQCLTEAGTEPTS